MNWTKWFALGLGGVLGVSHIGMIGMLARRDSSRLPSLNIPVGKYTSYETHVSENAYSVRYKANDPKVMQTVIERKKKGGFLNLANNTNKEVIQLQEQLEEFGTRKEMLDTAAGRLDTQTAGIQQSMKQYGGTRDIQKKTGLVTGGPDFALEDIETQGEMQMSNIGAGRKDILSQRELIAGQERQATTQSEIDKYKYGTETSTAMAKMMSDYMAATGEDVPEEFYDMFTEYSEQYV